MDHHPAIRYGGGDDMIQTTEIPAAQWSTEPPPSPVPVCHLSMSLETGGLERLLVDYARFGDTTNFRPIFVALNSLGPPAHDIRAQGFSVYSLRFAEVGKLAIVRRLAKLLKKESVQVVHTHNVYPHFYGALAAKLAGVPIVVNTQHGLRCDFSWKHHLQFRFANRWTQRIAGVSEHAARLCRKVDPRSAGKITCIWNGIDLSRFHYHGPRIESDRITAISVARLSPEKDFPTLFRAVAQVVREFPTFHLLMIGDGEERSKLESLTEELGLGRHVEFLGERSDVPQLLAQAGFFVSSSLIEGISLTLLEASAVGLPIVATSVGGNPEIVEDGRTGRLVPSANVEQLAAALLEMCRDQEAWQAMGLLGRRRVEACFDVRRMIHSYESLYSELLAKT